MKYLLVVLAILAVLSPLMWLRPSPGQLRVSRLRQKARLLGLRVQLVPAADAPRDERQPGAVRYLLPMGGDGAGSVSSTEWLLLRSERRGQGSAWPEWRWLRGEAPAATGSQLGRLLGSLPEDVEAICQDAQGISVYWREKGEEEQLDRIYNALEKLSNTVR